MGMTNSNDVARTVVLAVFAFVGVMILLMVFSMPMMAGMHAGTWGTDTGTFGLTGWLWMGLLPLVVLVLLLYGGLRLLRSDDRHDPAIDELRQAYARGDLTDEEFETRRQRLEDERDRRS